MRAALLMTALFAAPALAHDNGVMELSDAMAKASAGQLSPLQMPDGSKLFRFAGKEPKGEELEMRYTDRIAQALGRAQWCANGWEEMKRTTLTRGLVLIEGRCR